VVRLIADLLKEFDTSRPIFKNFQPGIGPYGEPQLVKKISELLTKSGYPCRTQRHPDLVIGSEWALEFKIVRPFGDNGKEAENWSVNLLHPYRGSVSAIGDAFNLMGDEADAKKAIFVIGYEHSFGVTCTRSWLPPPLLGLGDEANKSSSRRASKGAVRFHEVGDDGAPAFVPQ
jgi:hypothetical protein